METVLEKMTKKLEALLEAQSTAHRAEMDALQAKIQTLTDAPQRLSVSSPQQKPKATSADTPLLDGSSTQDTKPPIQQISEDDIEADIEAVVESIRTMARIK
ncbi:hypothetical protein CPB97_008276 [Podila verticillata]|nr:hypothetical protein CPB97_008276 [Podila verticillata]